MSPKNNQNLKFKSEKNSVLTKEKLLKAKAILEAELKKLEEKNSINH